MQPISSTPFRDTYRFSVGQTKTGHAYADVNGDGRFDRQVDRQIMSCGEDASSALMFKDLQEAVSGGQVLTTVTPQDPTVRLGFNDSLPGVEFPLTSVQVHRGESGLEVEATVQKMANILEGDGKFRLDHDGDGKPDTNLVMSVWLAPGRTPQDEQDAVDWQMAKIDGDLAFPGQSGPWKETGPSPDEPKLSECPSPFIVWGQEDVTRTFTVDRGEVSGNCRHIRYGLAPWPDQKAISEVSGP